MPWPDAIEEMTNAISRLSDAIARLTVDDLDKKVAGRKYTIYVMLHGVIQHNLYHAGQIALLKKARLSFSAPPHLRVNPSPEIPLIRRKTTIPSVRSTTHTTTDHAKRQTSGDGGAQSHRPQAGSGASERDPA